MKDWSQPFKFVVMDFVRIQLPPFTWTFDHESIFSGTNFNMYVISSPNWVTKWAAILRQVESSTLELGLHGLRKIVRGSIIAGIKKEGILERK